MRTLGMHVWKEWRENRAALLAVALVLAGLVTVAAAVTPPGTFADGIVAGATVVLAVLTTLLVLGGDFLAREARSRRLQFLDRLPPGLGAPFAAKLGFFVATAAGAGAFGALLASAASLARAGVLPEPAPGGAVALVPLAGVALWTFAVSPWVPRGSLSLPLALLVTAVVGAPCLLFGGWVDWSGARWLVPYEPARWEVFGFVGLSLAGAPFAAWVSFVRGRAAGGSGARAALLGVASLLAVCLPAWGWSAFRLVEGWSVDPRADGVDLPEVIVEPNGKHAYVRAVQPRRWAGRRSAKEPLPWMRSWEQASTRLFHVDLETGAYQTLGSTRARLQAAPRQEPEDEPTIVLLDEDVELLVAGQRHPVALEAFTDLHRSSVRRAGLGWRRFGEGEGWYDPTRGRSFPASVLDTAWRTVVVGDDAWLVKLEGSHRWYRFDPEARALTELPWPESPSLQEPPMLADGRVLFAAARRAWLGDPRDGSLHELEVADGRTVHVLKSAYAGGAPLQANRPLLVDALDRVLVFDGRRTLAPLESRGASLRVLAALDAGSVLALEGRKRLVRIEVATGERGILFPRP